MAAAGSARPATALAGQSRLRLGAGARAALAATGTGAVLGLLATAAASGPDAIRIPLAAGLVSVVVLAVVEDLRRLLLGIIVLDVSLQAGRFLGYQDMPALQGAIGGVEISATTIAIVLLWAMRLGTGPSPLGPAARREVHRVAIPLCLYVAAVALSLATAADKGLALAEVALLVQTLAIVLYVATSLRRRADVLFVVAMILVGVAVQGLLALSTLVGGPTLDLGTISTRVDDDGGVARFGGTIGSPNNAAAFFAMFLVIALAVLVASPGRRRRALAACALALGGLGLVATLGRGGWLGFLVAALVFGVLAHRRGLVQVRLRGRTVVALTAFVVLFGGVIGARLAGNDNDAAGSRVPLLVTAERIISDHPLTGVGANNYAVAAAPYRTRDMAEEWAYTVHNKYLVVLSEGGIIAFLPFVWFLVAAVRLGWRASAAGDRTLRILSLGLVGAIVGNMVHMTVEILNGRGAVQGLWLIAGLIAAIAAIGAAASAEGEVRP